MQHEFDFTETHEHVGGSEGGYATETHELHFENGKATHRVVVNCNDNNPSDFGLSAEEKLDTKEKAQNYVKSQLETLRKRLVELEQCEQALLAATSYEDVSDYSDYEEEEEDED